MIRFIDISNWQRGLELSYLVGQIQGLALKATEGVSYVDPYCDGWYQQAKRYGLCRAFYHFAGTGDADSEAQFFYENTRNYFNDAVPVLDWEGNQDVAWVNKWVDWIHGKTDVWPWIYANPWRFQQGGVNKNCMRWVASYPSVTSPAFEQAETWDAPAADDGGLVGAWQFCSDGRLSGYSGNLDLDLFYGDKEMWGRYADPNASAGGDHGSDGSDNCASGGQSWTLTGNGIKVQVEVER